MSARYPKKLIARIREMYEIGRSDGSIKNLRELHKYISEKVEGRIPSYEYLRRLSSQQKWNTEKVVEDRDVEYDKEFERARKQHEVYVAKFEYAGVTEEKIVEIVKSMLEDDSPSVRDKGIQRFQELTGHKAPIQKPKEDNSEKQINQVVMLPVNTFEPRSS